jgi:hypothetical protein
MPLLIRGLSRSELRALQAVAEEAGSGSREEFVRRLIRKELKVRGREEPEPAGPRFTSIEAVVDWDIWARRHVGLGEDPAGEAGRLFWAWHRAGGDPLPCPEGCPLEHGADGGET